MNYSILFGSILFLSACRNSSNNAPEETIEIVKFDTVGNAISENNLKQQLNEYLVAFHNGDPDKAISYIYPESFNYILQQYPNEKINIEQIKEELFRKPSRELKEMRKIRNMKYEFVIDSIKHRVSFNFDRIYTVVISIDAKWELKKYTTGEELICISEDNGNNWLFFSVDKESLAGILSIKYPKKVVEEVVSSTLTGS